MKKQNFIFIALILSLCAVILVVGAFRGSGKNALVMVSEKETIKISLSKDKTYSIQTGNLPVTLQVEQGKIRFVESKCPDHVCEGFGWIYKEEDTAICAPARVAISIE